MADEGTTEVLEMMPSGVSGDEGAGGGVSF